jgi:hypothetical protein
MWDCKGTVYILIDSGASFLCILQSESDSKYCKVHPMCTLKCKVQRRSVGYYSYSSIYILCCRLASTEFQLYMNILFELVTNQIFFFLFNTAPFVEILPLTPFSSNWSQAVISMHLVWRNASFVLHQGRCCAEYNTVYRQTRKRRWIFNY